ncbi:MAG TPA: hypothetical protein VFQ88_11070 [Nevskiaceae bacterium]|nr:hypothetical protein [Nevskiaceae bacterium]
MIDSNNLLALQITQDHGALVVRRATCAAVTLADELARNARTGLPRHLCRTRAFTGTDGTLGALVNAVHRAARWWLDRSRDDLRQVADQLVMLDVTNDRVRTLDASPNANLDWWLRQRAADTGSVLVEVCGLDPSSFLAEYSGLVSPVAAPVTEDATSPASPESPDTGPRAIFRDDDPAARWLTAAEVSRKLGSSARTNLGQYATALRQRGKLFAVWSTDGACYRFPPWQFRTAPDDRLLPTLEMPAILQSLRAHGSASNPDRRAVGWGNLTWFTTPNALLDSAAPSTLLTTDPAAVLRAAQAESVHHSYAQPVTRP